MNRPRRHDGVPRQARSRAAGSSWLALALASTLMAVGSLARGQGTDAQAPRPRALAATCSHCHGIDGHAVEGESFARLAGRPADELLAQLMAFRSGQRPATVMQQIAKGYTPEQLESLARYFAGQK